jgi:gliding motility-associated-like protein
MDQFTVVDAAATNYASIIWTTNGAGSLVNETTLNPTYIPATGETGNITLTLTVNGNADCGQIQDDMIIHLQSAPIVNAGNDTSLCSGNSYSTITATSNYATSVLWTTSGDGIFGNPGQLNTIYTPGIEDITNGSVILTLTGSAIAPCNTAIADSMLLTITSGATAYAGADTNTCKGIAYTISDAIAQNYISLVWTHNGSGTLSNETTLTPTYTPAANETGAVVLTLNVTGNSLCGDTSDSKRLYIFDYPIVAAGPDFSSCDISTITLSGAMATNTQSVFWTSTGSGTFNNPTLVNPTYTPSEGDVTNGSVNLIINGYGFSVCGNTSDSVTILLTKAAQVYAGMGDTICNGDVFTITNATVTGATSYTWSHNGTGTLQNTNTLSPTYIPGANESGEIQIYLSAMGTLPCGLSIDSITLIIRPMVTIHAGADIESCLLAPVSLSATGSGYQNIVWTSTGTGTFDNANSLITSYHPTEADIETGTIQLYIQAIGYEPCGDVTDTLNINFHDNPVAFAGNDTLLCAHLPITLSGVYAKNYSSLNWTHNGTGTFDNPAILHPVYTPGENETGQVTLKLTAYGFENCSGLISSDRVTITIQPAITVDAGFDDAIPTGSYTILHGSVTGGSGNFSYNWSPEQYLMDNTSLTPKTLILNTEVVFVLTAMDMSTTCSASDSVTISMGGIQRPIANDDYDTTEMNVPITIGVLENDLDPINLGLNVRIFSQPENGTATLNTDGTITYTPNSEFAGNDSLTYIICDNGTPSKCDTAKVYILVFFNREEFEIFNLITPNGDGKNDYWHISAINEYPDNNVMIFNRWGDKIIEIGGYNNSTRRWEGKNSKNEPVPDGVYYYILEIKDWETFTGWIYVRGKGDK